MIGLHDVDKPQESLSVTLKQALQAAVESRRIEEPGQAHAMGPPASAPAPGSQPETGGAQKLGASSHPVPRRTARSTCGSTEGVRVEKI